jgi:hypothetical protein
MVEHLAPLRRRVNADNALLEVRARSGVFNQMEQDAPEYQVRFQQVRRFRPTLGQMVELFPECSRRL